MEAAAVQTALGLIGAAMVMTISAVGSAIGIGIAGQAAVGAWKKCFAQGKTAPFLLAVFIGAPITQTFYGMIVMFTLITQAKLPTANGLALLGWGLLGGLAIAFSAIYQGKIAACASDAQGETGQGFTNYLIALGIVESVAIFVMVFILISVK
jgi:V/A-type H+-transporting ATPase subunit K